MEEGPWLGCPCLWVFMLLEFQTLHPVHPCTPDSVVGLLPHPMYWCLLNSRLLLALLCLVTQVSAHNIPLEVFLYLIPKPKGWIYVNCERVWFHRHLIEDGCAVLKAPQDRVFPLGCQENMKLLFQKQLMPPCFISEIFCSCRCHKAVSASDKLDSMEHFTPIRLVKGRIQHIFQSGEKSLFCSILTSL